MKGVQRLLTGDKNFLRSAGVVLQPGNVQPVDNPVVRIPLEREGNAVLEIGGTYTGAEERVFEFEILSTTATVPLLSQPQLSGKGSGNMSDLAVSGLPAQEITVELKDIGEIETAAVVDFMGQRLAVLAAGLSGNNLNLRVDRSGIVVTPTSFVLLRELVANTQQSDGPEYDWDSAVGLPDGEIPTDAKRVMIGDDRLNVYLQWKTLTPTGPQYHFFPAIQQQYNKGDKVYEVTGTYTVKLYNGSSLLETYAGLVTLYDFLDSVKRNSSYIKPLGVVAKDRNVDGQAATEIRVRTDAYVQYNRGQGSQYATGFTDVAVGDSAAMQLITATCVGNSPNSFSNAAPGAEIWELSSSASGILKTNLRTDELYSDGTITLRVPKKLPPGYVSNAGKITKVGEDIAYNKDHPESPVQICFEGRLGVNARAMSIDLTYKPRPTGDCLCAGFAKTPSFNPACLGTLVDGDSDMTYSTENRARLKSLYEYVTDVTRNNSRYLSRTPYIDPFVADGQERALQRIAQLFHTALDAVQALPDTDPLRADAEAAWDLQFARMQNDVDQYVADPLSEIYTAGEALAAGDFVAIVPQAGGFTASLEAAEDIAAGRFAYAITIDGVTKLYNLVTTVVGEAQVVVYVPSAISASATGTAVYKGELSLTGIQASPPRVNNVPAQPYTWAAGLPLYCDLSGRPQLAMGSIITGALGQTKADGTPLNPLDVTKQYIPPAGLMHTGASLSVNVTQSLAADLVDASVNMQDPRLNVAAFLRAVKSVANAGRYGYVLANVSSGDKAQVFFAGNNDVNTGTNGVKYYLSAVTPGAKTADILESLPNTGIELVGTGSATSVSLTNPVDGSWPGQGLILERYEAAVNVILITGGISPLGKFDASTVQAGDGCWQDILSEKFYWEVRTSDELLLPAFNNRVYYSSRNTDGKAIATKEFAFSIQVKCPEKFQIGDTIRLQIGDAVGSAAYQLGDELLLGVIAGNPLYFRNGQDGDNLLHWYVTGSVSGAFPPYTADRDSPALYSEAGLEFRINSGGIPFAIGDTFNLAVEGGQYRWRQIENGVAGSWSASADVPAGTISLGSGLSAQFSLTEAPNFATGDVYRLKALQPNAVSNILRPPPVFDYWAWSAGSGHAELIIDLGSVREVSALAIGLHNLGATDVLVDFGTASGAPLVWGSTAHTYTIAGRADLMGLLLENHGGPQSTRYVRIRPQTSAAGRVGYVHIGGHYDFTYSAKGQIARAYAMERSGGDVNRNAVYRGKSLAGQLTWSEGSILQEDYDKMSSMIDFLKANGEEGFILFLQASKENFPMFVRTNADRVDFADVYDFQGSDDLKIRLAATIALDGVFA